MVRALPLLPLLILPAACATVGSGVVPAGAPGGYVITERDSPVNGGAATAQRNVMAAAAAYCRKRGESFVPGEIETLGRPVQASVVGPTGVRLTFRCNDPNAPDPADPAAGAPP